MIELLLLCFVAAVAVITSAHLVSSHLVSVVSRDVLSLINCVSHAHHLDTQDRLLTAIA
jgi:hypothetical protein